MKDHPILFSTQMVKAILAGNKTMTRRAMKPQPIQKDIILEKGFDKYWEWKGERVYQMVEKAGSLEAFLRKFCPYGCEGDLLWVRETWQLWLKGFYGNGYIRLINFPADNTCIEVPDKYLEWYDEKEKRGYIKRPSIHMPKWMSRIWLKVKDIRVERLQDISEEDAIKEGVEPNTLDGVPIEGEYFKYPLYKYEDGFPAFSAVESFQYLWDSINGEPRKDGQDISWDANPFVWCISFERTEKPNKE